MRGAVVLEGVAKSFGGGFALREVSLEVPPGEFLTLLGPSGCGKTTLLRLIAGFEQPDAGKLSISGRDVAPLPPHERPVNTVFQHYALFPHRSVGGNVGFGLEMRGLGGAELRRRVGHALELVRLPGFEERRVESLSGGEKQRVALARAIVLEPDVLLLDEPLAALDLKLRKEMQLELKNLQERLATTFVFVTHDQEEALIMSDRVAVMNAGRIEQTGAPDELYERPRNRFVADFLAVRNILEATVEGVAGGRVRIASAGGLLLFAQDDGGYAAGAKVVIGLRPERFRVEGAQTDLEGEGQNALSGVIEDEIYLGDRTEWRVRCAGELLTVAEAAASAARRKRGDVVRLAFPASAVLRLQADPRL